MKTAGVKRIWFLAVPAVLLLLWFACRPVDYLLVTTIENEQTLLALPLTHGPDFSIGYIHSVDIKPIFEVFTVKSGPGDRRDIYIVETYFKMFGAGMGHWAGHGRLIRKDGWTWIKDINKNLKEFILRIGSPGVDHTIYYNDRKINLSESAPGRAALFRVISANRLRASMDYWPD